MNPIIRVGHSPDPDDAFMFYGLAKGFIKVDGFKIDHLIEDIQSLNQRALKAELDVTAISAAVYPFISENYWILSCGASVGRNYGPIVLARERFLEKDLNGKRIAIPGTQTTASLLLKIFLDDFEPVEMNFSDIISAVKEKKVDAGLVIHEGQINFASFGLYCCLDLGGLWYQKYSLPIPLGLDVVRKDLGKELAEKIGGSLLKSIQFARANREEAIDYALKFGRGISKDEARKFVGMYVNEDTVNLNQDCKSALEKLYAIGKEKKVFSFQPPLEIINCGS